MWPVWESLEDRRMLSTLDYSTFLGGSLPDSALAVAADGAGNTYVTGTTASANFPATVGAFDGSLNGIYDAFVAKFRPDGTLSWATYLGGAGDERGHGIAVDAGGNVYVTGRTDSANFPTTTGSLDTMLSGAVDAFVTKLSADGSALIYSTYLGGAGNEIDDGFDKLSRRVGDIVVDAAGQAYVIGSTTSANFPTTTGAFRTTNAGFIDAFVSKLNAGGTALVYSTYLGGNDNDRGHSIAVDAAGNAYVSGEVWSVNFPTTAGAFQTVHAGGGSETFVTKLNAAGSGLVYSSFLGGTQGEFPGRLAIDAAGQAYVTGATTSFNFPTTAGAFQTARAANGFDAFVTKVNAAGSALVYSTYLGGSFGNDFGEEIAVDGSGQAYVTGFTASGAFPVADAFQPSRSGVNDAFITKLNASGTALVYSSYLGGGNGSGFESGYGVAVDAGGVAHVVGSTSTSGFPTTAPAFQPTFGGGAEDAFVSRITGEDEQLPSLSLNDAKVTEGNTGTQAASFTVTLSATYGQPITVTYATGNGTATVGSDYQATSGTLTIPAGQTTGTFTVLVNGDRLGELDETYFVNLGGATNATIADGTGVGTIVDDEPRISISDVAKLEGIRGQTTRFVFTVTLSTAYDQAVTMSFRTVNGTATTLDSDFVAKKGTLTFSPGETTKTITIVVKGDNKNEADEAFFLDLSDNSANSLFTKKRGIGTILNDD
jgi:Calx-beta domain/Beta-propeller repeat